MYLGVALITSSPFFCIKHYGNPILFSQTFENSASKDSDVFIFHHPMLKEFTNGYKINYYLVIPKNIIFSNFSVKANITTCASGMKYTNTGVNINAEFSPPRVVSEEFYSEKHLFIQEGSYTQFNFTTSMTGFESIHISVYPVSRLLSLNLFIQSVFHTLIVISMIVLVWKMHEATKSVNHQQDKFVLFALFSAVFHIDSMEAINATEKIFVPRFISSLYTSVFPGVIVYYLHAMQRERLHAILFPPVSKGITLLFSTAVSLSFFGIKMLNNGSKSKELAFAEASFIGLVTIPLISAFLYLKRVPNSQTDTNISNKYLFYQVIFIYAYLLCYILATIHLKNTLYAKLIQIWSTTLASGWIVLKRVKSEDSHHYIEIYTAEKEMREEKIKDRNRNVPYENYQQSTEAKNENKIVRSQDKLGESRRDFFESSSTYT